MTEYGVIIARFQVPELHLGHTYLIKEVMRKHERVVVLLGVSSSAANNKNPLSFFVRKQMLKQHFPTLDIEPLHDIPGDDILWSDQIDGILSTYPGKPIMYGSRDSALNSYHGKHKVFYIDAVYERSGTDIREELKEPINNSSFRAGIIHSIMNRYPMVYPTVDIAVCRLRSNGYDVLLGRKPNQQKWRFPGGFLNKGETSLDAAKRELSEEVGLIEVAGWKFIGSHPVDDPRYKGTNDGILTTFYHCQYMYGEPKAADDLAEVKWFDINEVADNVVPEHCTLAVMLKAL